jgi:hypothetical protein
VVNFPYYWPEKEKEKGGKEKEKEGERRGKERGKKRKGKRGIEKGRGRFIQRCGIIAIVLPLYSRRFPALEKQ